MVIYKRLQDTIDKHKLHVLILTTVIYLTYINFELKSNFFYFKALSKFAHNINKEHKQMLNTHDL